ncbi:phosphoribosylamine--glycine ligase [Jeotgalibacillus alimentarius]|uniref:Phosphoribosylamine--glycine ligase n=1 Tax=Jeotgalibacillus alimentarius TaxID=135826 RepID=A0A0C2VP50_9BACL|nr:phosphoribosylamine--glycine ligase [Jeotgalibacillus alimentarius]KIL50672.1 phosphoribosylamine--glycine ligase [Jeotgalibacillus alimentarius]
MNVLVIGRGGREHALCYKFSKDASVDKVFCAPGNAGIAEHATCVDIKETDQHALVEFAKSNDIALTVIGPEQPLSEGLADAFAAAELKVFGPSQKASAIEGSKAFAKELMKKYDIPTAGYETFTDFAEASVYIKQKGAPIVIKADGLAAGKGVVVAMNVKEALQAAEDMLEHNRFGASSAKVVVEDFLDGEEFSFMCLVNGNRIIPLALAQDHKRAYDNDEGPNTGGMGAYSPVTHLPAETEETAMKEIIKPVVEAMEKEQLDFTGVLYAGLILTSEGPKVIEFNARFGDPETQVVLHRLKSDLAHLLLSLLDGEDGSTEWSDETVVGVVIASEGYPGDYQKEQPLASILKADTFFYHAGTKMSDDEIVSDGGRVLLAAGAGANVEAAQTQVYQALQSVHSDHFFYRTDIGNKALKRS